MAASGNDLKTTGLAEGLADLLEGLIDLAAPTPALYGPPPDIPDPNIIDDVDVSALYGPPPDFDEEAVLYGPFDDGYDDIPEDLYGPYSDFDEGDYPNYAGWEGFFDDKNYRPNTIKDIWRVWRQMKEQQ